ncbi:MAG: tRNA (adenosine(37)-N6)-dimethylallyltransferase MiaA [Phycisphaerales bacterium]
MPATPRFPVIIGPTAGGKSALAMALCDALRDLGRAGEIVSADAIQIYRGLDIGSAKPTHEEQAAAPHHLIDVVEPEDAYSVHQWLAAANAAIDDIRTRNAVPIVVGGTHLYVKALLDGLFDGPGADEALRDELRAMDPAARRAELERADPQAAARIHFNDERRTVRALEVFRLTGRPISAHQAQWDTAGPRADALLVGLEWETDAINARINERVREMVRRGLVEEARALWEAQRFGPQSREALGYKQLIAHFERRATQEEAIEAIKIETRRFAKNQRTWMRRLLVGPAAVAIKGDPVDTSGCVDMLVRRLCGASE